MGKEFGNLAHIRGIVYYKISQYEQRAFANVLFGLYNFIPRSLSRMVTWLVPFTAGYATYVTCEALHYSSKRKDIRIYDSEVMPEGYEFPEDTPKLNKK